jgi:hypothetical protein
MFTGARPLKKKSWSWGPPTVEKGWVAFLKAALRKCITEGGLSRARLFYTFYPRRVVHLAKRTTRMWEYSGHANPDRVSRAEMPYGDVWSLLEMVSKMGNQQTISGPATFDEGYPPNLVSLSPFFLSVGS